MTPQEPLYPFGASPLVRGRRVRKGAAEQSVL